MTENLREVVAHLLARQRHDELHFDILSPTTQASLLFEATSILTLLSQHGYEIKKTGDINEEMNTCTCPDPLCFEHGRIYPCDNCGTMRTKDEGGTTFTVCDKCWDRSHKQKANP